MRQVRDAAPFPPIPVVVLTGTNKWLEGPAFNRVWLQTQQEMSELSPKGTHVVCDHCGHYVHRDDPRLVVDAIRDVIARGTPGTQQAEIARR
jgi:pimeloyl-ACP methyl ester carboxylesterase